jgi:NHLM bacteriocin system ABC transporter ATP-binding protein
MKQNEWILPLQTSKNPRLPSIPFVLDKQETCVVFEGGPVDLFIQRKGGGERTLLATFEEGELLFSPEESSDFEWIAMSTGKTTYFEIPYSAMDGKEVSFINNWMEKLKEHCLGVPVEENLPWKDRLSHFSHLLLLGIADEVQHEEEVESTLQANRKHEEKKLLQNALRQMKAVFAPSSLLTVLDNAKDPLEIALRTIGFFMKIEFIFPRKSYDLNLPMRERINLICSASKIQKREVKLDATWWHQNHGSMLGFSPEGAPTPLIRLDRYKRFQGDQSDYVTDKIAKEIGKQGYMFYRHFDLRLKTGKEALSFFAKNYWKELIKIIPIACLGVLFAMFPPIATSILFSYAVPSSDYSLVFYLFIGLLFSSIGFAFFYLYQGLVYLQLQGLGSHLIQTGFWDRLLRLSPLFFRKYTVGNLFTRIFSIEDIRTAITNFGSTIPISLLFALLYLSLMVFYSPLLSLIAGTFALLGLAITLLFAHLKVDVLRESFEFDGNLRGTVIQMIQGVTKLRIAGVSDSAFAHWASAFAKNNTLKLRAQIIQNGANLVSTVFPLLSLFFIYFALLHGVSISLPNFLAFNIAFGSFNFALYPIYNSIVELSDSIPRWERAQIILHEPLEEKERSIAPGKLTGNIRIQNVTFGYDPNLPPVLSNLSLQIKPKQFVGIVGRTGCGKSTLFRLLLSFEKPSSGVIYYDGIDLQSLNLQLVRNQLGVVLQDQGIMGGTLYEVVSSGGLYSQADFDRAFQLSGFADELASFPMGLNTVIPVNGKNLSGGQRQRLMLARALIGSPSILLFDEATSALDNNSQSKLMHNIESMPLTKILIAQRLNTVRNADIIYVIDQRTIVQTGTYDELSKQPGLFSEMLRKSTSSK